jgi:hypothetical protein
MTYVELFYIGIAENNYDLKSIKIKLYIYETIYFVPN